MTHPVFVATVEQLRNDLHEISRYVGTHPVSGNPQWVEQQIDALATRLHELSASTHEPFGRQVRRLSRNLSAIGKFHVVATSVAAGYLLGARFELEVIRSRIEKQTEVVA